MTTPTVLEKIIAEKRKHIAAQRVHRRVDPKALQRTSSVRGFSDALKAKQALAEAFGEIDYEVDEIQFIAQNTAPVTGDDVEMFERFMAMLNDLDDVQDIYHNVEPS